MSLINFSLNITIGAADNLSAKIVLSYISCLSIDIAAIAS